MAGHRRTRCFAALIATAMLATSSAAQLGRVHAQQPAALQAPASAGAESSKGSAASGAQSGKTEGVSKAPSVGNGIPALVIDGAQVLGVIGKQVRSSAGEDMGRIVDVIIDRSARVRAAVIDFGGFLGVGNRQIAVAWSAIRHPAQDKPGALVVDFTRDQLRVAPAYKAGEQVVLLGQADPTAAATNGTADKEASPREPTSR